jgi:hypothetical protein
MNKQKIKQETIIEGNLQAVKDTQDFGGVNTWYLNVKCTNGSWNLVQAMGVYQIQKFFKTKLPVYSK